MILLLKMHIFKIELREKTVFFIFLETFYNLLFTGLQQMFNFYIVNAMWSQIICLFLTIKYSYKINALLEYTSFFLNSSLSSKGKAGRIVRNYN